MERSEREEGTALHHIPLAGACVAPALCGWSGALVLHGLALGGLYFVVEPYYTTLAFLAPWFDLLLVAVFR